MARKRDLKVAKARAKVRFGPEHSTINALLGQAQGTYASDLVSADAAAQSAVHFADKSRKPTAAIFDTARSQADAARSDVEAAFGRLGAAADPFRAATTRGHAAAAQRTALAGARALHELTERKLEAQAGRQYARTQASTDYRKSLGSLAERLRDLGDREGAFIVEDAAKLSESRAERKADLRKTRLGIEGSEKAASVKFGRDKELAKFKSGLTGGGGSGLGGGKPATRAERRGFQSDFAKALSYAKQYPTRAAARAELIPGGPAVTDKAGKVIAPGAPSIDDQLALSAALDMRFDGHVSRANARAMKKQAGLRVADIRGATSYSDWLRKRAPRGSSGGAGGPRGSGRL